MSQETRVCVVGMGRAGMVHAENLRWRVPGARLEAVVDTELGRANQAASDLHLPGAAYTSLDEALRARPFDAVVITTPTFTHAELAIAAAKAGKGILCEKPMALTLAECDAMIEAAEKAEVVLQMGFMRRFDPAFQSAKGQMEEGLIGKPLIVRSLTRGPGLPPPWARDPRTSNGMLAEVNSHDFDTIRWLGGGNYTSAFTQAGAFKVPELLEQYPDFYDTAVVCLRLDNGAFGMLDGVCPADYGYDARAEVVGTEGTLIIGEMRESAITRITRDGGIAERHFTSWPARFAQAYLAEMTHLVDCIQGRAPLAVDGQDGRKALEAVLVASQSLRAGQPATFPLDEAQEER